MKFIAVLTISILLIGFVLSTSGPKNLPKDKTKITPQTLSPQNTKGNQLKPDKNIKPAEKLPEILKKDVKALQGCYIGRCIVKKGILQCYCKVCESKMSWKRVCVGPKGNQRCLCEPNCTPIQKPTGCLAKHTSSSFVSTWFKKIATDETLTHLACACWKEYESNCKLEICNKVNKYNTCIKNLKGKSQIKIRMKLKPKVRHSSLKRVRAF